MAYEDKELKPYKEPSKDVLELKRIGKSGDSQLVAYPSSHICLKSFCLQLGIRARLGNKLDNDIIMNILV